LDQPDRKVPAGFKALRDRKGNKDPLDRKVCKVSRVSQDFKGLKVRLDSREFKEFRVRRVSRE
jgi:hypothetical protein